ncbi:unnamed protein product [Cylicocyclus nassatus]|uniref:Uncharacterized protein n=1 Tax=Cylicocyclus nassatus TaxID=53992 RepID=A0AA36HEE6_CYLNA|nr:unnamed protein product [Cylicocyclus nassatus]
MSSHIIIVFVTVLFTVASSSPIVNVNIEDKCCDQAAVNGTNNPIVNVNIDDKCCEGLDVKKIADAVCNTNCSFSNQYVSEFCRTNGYALPGNATKPVV